MWVLELDKNSVPLPTNCYDATRLSKQVVDDDRCAEAGPHIVVSGEPYPKRRRQVKSAKVDNHQNPS